MSYEIWTDEPCSDVEISKDYYAEATLCDTRFGPPTEGDTFTSSPCGGTARGLLAGPLQDRRIFRRLPRVPDPTE